MKTVKTWLPLLGLPLLGLIHSCSKGTQTITKTVTDTLTVTDTVRPVLPNYADSVKIGEWAYYKFNGNLSDSSGNNHNMTGYDNIGFTDDMWGNANGALNFTGSGVSGQNTYAVIDSGVNFPNGNFSVNFLMMTRATSGRIFEKADYTNAEGASITFDSNPTGSSTSTTIFDLGICKVSDICSTTSDTSDVFFLQPTNPINIYAWEFVTLNYNGQTESIYINGQLAGSTPTTGPTYIQCPNSPFYLGMWWLQDLHPFNGKIDELRIYTRALSLGEIQYLSNAALTDL